MACKVGTNRIQEGLIFHYDMDNQQKSWLGEPTTNLIPSPQINGRFGPGNAWGTYGTNQYNGNTYFSIGTIASVTGNIVTTTVNHPFNTFDACMPQTTGGGLTAGVVYFIKKISPAQFSLHAYNNSQDGSQGYFIPGTNFHKVHESIALDQKVSINATSFPTMWWGPPHYPNVGLVKELISSGGPKGQRFIRLHSNRTDATGNGMAYNVNSPVTIGDKISLSYYVRSNKEGSVISMSTYFGPGFWYDESPTYCTKDWVKVRHNWVASATYSFIKYFWVQIDTDKTYWIDMCDLQVEVNTKSGNSTPFTTSARSNTQSIIDLTGNNVISASTISFNQDNTFYFNGTTDKISVPIPLNYQTVTNDTNRSWEVVAEPNAVLTNAGIFGTSYTDGCTYFCNGGIAVWGGTYRFSWYDGSSYFWLDSGVAATVNVPVHIVATWNKADYKPRIYVNGILKAIYGSATNLNFSNTQGVYQIGYLSAAGQRFSGKIPVVRNYFNKALTDQEILWNYESYRSRL